MANNYLKDNTWDKYVPLLFYFYIYEYSSSGDSWSHVIDFLGLQFKNNPKEMSLFLKFMSIPEEKGGSLYVNDFCDAVEAYYNSIGESLPFDFSILPSRCTPECDTDESHKDWYEKVPKIKYQGCDNYLFRYLGKLYDRLVEKDWIEKDYLHLPVYYNYFSSFEKEYIKEGYYPQDVYVFHYIGKVKNFLNTEFLCRPAQSYSEQFLKEIIFGT